MNFRNTIRAHALQTRLGWKFRNSYHRLKFLFFRRLFILKKHSQDSAERTRTLGGIVRSSTTGVLWPLVVALTLLYLDSILQPFVFWLGINNINPDTYTTLLATVTGIGGVFIGLYYTAISAVAGTVYSTVPNDIRNLLSQDRLGNVYMRSLAFLTILGVILLALAALNFQALLLAVPIFSVWASFAIVAFVYLGARAFDLFDPTTLSHDLFRQLDRTQTEMQAGAYRWNDPAFQDHSRRSASLIISSLETLGELCKREPRLQSHSYLSLVQGVGAFLIKYEAVKKQIPTNSKWWNIRYTHPEWYRTGDTTTSILHQTATAMDANPNPDRDWVEDRLLPILFDFVTVSIRRADYNLTRLALTYIDSYVHALAYEQRLGRAVQLVDRTVDVVIESAVNEVEEIAKEEKPETLALADFVARLPITLLLAFVHSTREFSNATIEANVRKIRWPLDSSLYRSGLLAHHIENLEWFRKRLQFEIEVEGHVLTPPWYISELTKRVESIQNRANYDQLVSNLKNTYTRVTKNTRVAKHPWISATFVSAEWEYWNKIGHHASSFERTWSEIQEHRRLEELNWPELDSFKNATRGRLHELSQQMSLLGSLLFIFDRPDSHPDFAGQFLHSTGENVFKSLTTNDDLAIKSLFESYFASTLQQFDRLRPTSLNPEDRSNQIDFKVAAAPLLDLMDLSGYAILFSEFFDNRKIAEPIFEIWNNYLDEETSDDRITLLSSCVAYTESFFELAHRSLLRSQWQQSVSQMLRSLERQSSGGNGRTSYWNEESFVHQSPLVRLIASSYIGLNYDGIDIFFELYISKRQNKPSEVNLGQRRRRNLKEELDREKTQSDPSSDDEPTHE